MRYNLPDIPPPKLISALRNYDLLPAIVFVPSRRKCDEYATEVALDRSLRSDADREKQRRELFEAHLLENPEVKRHRHRDILLRAGVASHHAGHLPAWKLIVEKMMSGGLLNAIFATSTVAAGVDFPARTVVVSNADTRGNDGWRPLSASELQQMTGRAGRRGKDKVGYIVLAPGKFQDPGKIAELLGSPADPLESKFRATYTSLLNLLDAFGSFAQVRSIAEKSFAFRDTSHIIVGLNARVDEAAARIRDRLGPFGISEESVKGHERLFAARSRIEQKLPTTRAEMRRRWLEENVEAGRIVARGKSGKNFLLVLNLFGDKVVAMRDDGRGTTFSIAQVKRVYQKKYPLNERSIEQAFYDIYEGRNPILKEPKLSESNEDTGEAVGLIDRLLDDLISSSSRDVPREKAERAVWECHKDADLIAKKSGEIESLRNRIWLPFERKARVLDHFGYLEFGTETVTGEGRWLADLRLDRPLLVGEALKEGIFEDLHFSEIAGFTAAIAADPDRDYGALTPSGRLTSILTEFEDVIYDVSSVEWNLGVEPEDEINLSAAAAAESWAAGTSWDSLVRNTRAEDGDLVRILSRTGEALMQIAGLKSSKPEAATAAKETAALVLREPIR